MTTHSEMIKEILESLTTYKGNQYPSAQNVDEVNEAVPKFIVYYDPTRDGGDNTMISETFKVVFKAATDASLDAIKAEIWALSSNLNGYTNPASNLIVYPLIDRLVKATLVIDTTIHFDITESTEATTADIETDSDNYLYILFTISDLTNFIIREGISFQITLQSENPVNQQAVEISMYCANGTTLEISDSVIVDYNSYKYTQGPLANWTDNQTYTISDTILREFIRDAINSGYTQILFQLRCVNSGVGHTGVVYQANAGNAAGKYPQLIYTAASTYPYWIDVKGGHKYPDPAGGENNYIEFEIEARWTI